MAGERAQANGPWPPRRTSPPGAAGRGSWARGPAPAHAGYQQQAGHPVDVEDAGPAAEIGQPAAKGGAEAWAPAWPPSSRRQPQRPLGHRQRGSRASWPWDRGPAGEAPAARKAIMLSRLQAMPHRVLETREEQHIDDQVAPRGEHRRQSPRAGSRRSRPRVAAGDPEPLPAWPRGAPRISFKAKSW